MVPVSDGIQSSGVGSEHEDRDVGRIRNLVEGGDFRRFISDEGLLGGMRLVNRRSGL